MVLKLSTHATRIVSFLPNLIKRLNEFSENTMKLNSVNTSSIKKYLMIYAIKNVAT